MKMPWPTVENQAAIIYYKLLENEMKPTYIKSTNTYLHNFQACGFPICRQAGILSLKTKLYNDEKTNPTKF